MLRESVVDLSFGSYEYTHTPTYTQRHKYTGGNPGILGIIAAGHFNAGVDSYEYSARSMGDVFKQAVSSKRQQSIMVYRRM